MIDTATTATSIDSERDDVQAAYEHVRDALRALDITDNFDRFMRLQGAYFDLKAALRALDPEWQSVDLPGTNVAVPSVPRPAENPTVSDEHGEVEAPTAYDDFRVLDGVSVCDPENPHTTHAVTVDHVVTPDGEVTCEVNAVPLPDVGTEAGSHIR